MTKHLDVDLSILFSFCTLTMGVHGDCDDLPEGNLCLGCILAQRPAPRCGSTTVTAYWRGIRTPCWLLGYLPTLWIEVTRTPFRAKIRAGDELDPTRTAAR